MSPSAFFKNLLQQKISPEVNHCAFVSSVKKYIFGKQTLNFLENWNGHSSVIIRGLFYILKFVRLFLDPSILTITSCSGQSEKNWEKFASKLFEENLFFFKALKLLVQLFKVRRILLPYYLKFSFSLRFLRPAQNFGLFRPIVTINHFFPALCKYNIIIIIITVLFISSVEIQIMTIEAVVIVSLLSASVVPTGGKGKRQFGPVFHSQVDSFMRILCSFFCPETSQFIRASRLTKSFLTWLERR